MADRKQHDSLRGTLCIQKTQRLFTVWAKAGHWRSTMDPTSDPPEGLVLLTHLSVCSFAHDSKQLPPTNDKLCHSQRPSSSSTDWWYVRPSCLRLNRHDLLGDSSSVSASESNWNEGFSLGLGKCAQLPGNSEGSKTFLSLCSKNLQNPVKI